VADRCSIEAAKLLRTLKKDLGEEEATKLMEDAREAILRKTRTAAVRNAGESAEDALLRATEDFLDEKLKSAFLAKRNALINLNLRLKAVDYVRRNFADDPALGVEALMTGVNRDIAGSRFSVSAEQTNLFNHYGTGLVADVHKVGAWKEFVRGVYDLDISRALSRLSNAEDDLGDLAPEAAGIARAIRKWQNEAWKDANDAGAFIGKDPSYITRQMHDMFRIRQASKRVTGNASNDPAVNWEAWRDFTAPLLDLPATAERFDVPLEELPRVLRQAYDALHSGVHLTNAAPGEVANIPAGSESIARRMSQERMLIFKEGGDSWIKYNEKFGTGNLAETVARSLELSASQTSLMRVFGPNAKMNFNLIFSAGERLAAKKGPQARAAFKDNAKRLNDIFMEIDGSIRVPGNAILARRAGAFRALQTMSKLGGAMLSAISDIPIAARGLQHNGLGFLESYGAVLGSVTKAFDTSIERLEFNSLVGTSMDLIRGDIMSRVTAHDTLSEGWSKRVALFFKMNGLSMWTDAIRNGVGDALSGHLALSKGLTLDALDPRFARTLKFYDIQSKEWEALRSMETRAFDGEDFITPEGVDGIDDGLIDPLIADQLEDLRTRHSDILAKDEAANVRDRGFVEERLGKFSDDIQKAQEDLAVLKEAFAGRQDDLATEIRSRIGRLEAEFSRAEAASDIESFVVSERNRTRFHELLERIEEGADIEGPGVSIDELAARESDRFSQTRGNQGERLGARRARTDRRISQATQKERRVSKELADRLGAREADLVRRLEKRAKTFEEFVARADERMAKRKARADELHRLFGRRVLRLRAEAKELLKRKLRTYFQDQVDFSVVVPDAKTNAFMNRGVPRGTPLGEALRFIMQFKSFPVAVLQRPVARELFSQGFSGPRRGLARDTARVLLDSALQNGHGEMQGLAQLLATTAAMGYAAMAAKDLAKGRTPRDPTSAKTWFAAMAQGGGLGIYGDFLFGEVKNRFGQTFIASAAGPTAGSIDDLFDIWGRMREGDDTAAASFNTILNHAPFANLFYLRMVMDFLFWHRIREGMNPGYLKRMERRIEKENGQRFLKPPSSVIPTGGGTIGDAAGTLADALNGLSPIGEG